MNLVTRIDLLERLGNWMQQNPEQWQAAKEKAGRLNPWFSPGFTNLAVDNIVSRFLQRPLLEAWVKRYHLPDSNTAPAKVGVVMAGNLPLVGFHDFLCVFITGHKIVIKLSSKDEVLLKTIVEQLYEWDERTRDLIQFAEVLKGCDAYIATGSNNSGRYFDFYFGKYPHIIRKNRSSVAILDGKETPDMLSALADDIQLYFGLGCRNVTQLYVPEGYDFIPLLEALKKYDHLADNHKYKHNFDYHLALLIMNSKFYMNNGSVVLAENVSPFSPVSQVHYQYYNQPKETLATELAKDEQIQCVVGVGDIPFGKAQYPELSDYADGVDTMQFLSDLKLQ
ncbi:acyl-CoA reductase [Filimonas effusa]|uniref:Acyl-CoA reductase n=2 Tax=Filimonas effusa TaxID=2508721 RepID=A0A4Q1DD18_9BACT|nr:acyl-CoA reductase [Filimonas effusa]